MTFHKNTKRRLATFTEANLLSNIFTAKEEQYTKDMSEIYKNSLEDSPAICSEWTCVFSHQLRKSKEKLLQAERKMTR